MEHIKKDRIINVPNALTLVRILLLPVVVWRFVLGDTTGALIVYMTAMLTDALDGIIARKTNQITALGKLLDPIADKLSLVTLLGLFVSNGEIPLWVLAIILFKEVMMVIGGGVALKHGIVVYYNHKCQDWSVKSAKSWLQSHLLVRELYDQRSHPYRPS